MSMLPVLIRQILIMFVFVMVGFVLNRGRIISTAGSGEIAKLLLYLVVPSVVIKSFQVTCTREALTGFLISFFATLLVIVLAMVVSRSFFKKDPVEHFAAAFCNPGFFGLPLVTAVMPAESLIYAVPFLAFICFFQWTYGVYILTNDRSGMAPKKVITNPMTIAFFIGLILFVLPFNMPSFVMDILGGITGLNTPLAMILLGFYLGSLKIRELFTGKNVIKCMIVRLLIIPLITVGLLSLIPAKYMDVRQVVLIEAATPVGTNVALFAQLYNRDSARAAKEVSLSTLLCIITIPLIVFLANLLWGIV